MIARSPFVPKPVLTFVIGVTGHRSARLADQSSHVRDQLAMVFHWAAAACEQEFKDRRLSYAESSEPQIHLITSMADGTDFLALDSLKTENGKPPLPCCWTAIGILPAPEIHNRCVLTNTARPERVADVLAQHDAACDASPKKIVLPKARGRDRNGFVRAGNLMLRQTDLLVAVWDGIIDDSPGGTSSLVQMALRDGIPVLRIHPGRDQPPVMLAELAALDQEPPAPDLTKARLEAAIRRELGLRNAVDGDSDDAAHHGKRPVSAEDRLTRFLEERQPHHTWPFYHNFKAGLLRPGEWRLSRPCTSLAQVRADWNSFLSEVPAEGAFRDRLEQILLPRFTAAEALATYYGNKYRSTYILAYQLAVVAVLMALLDLAYPSLIEVWPRLEARYDIEAARRTLAIVELIAVTAIVVLVACGRLRRNDWHERWLDYRALAETLRHLRFLGLLGQYEKSSYAEAAARPGAGWLLWYLRATMRELGLPEGEISPGYQQKALEVVKDAELQPQIRYHRENVDAMTRLHGRLHVGGDLCFMATAAVLVLFLIFSFAGGARVHALEHYAFMIPFVTAFLPALGATFAGIRFTGDFDGFAKRSAATLAELESLKQHYELVHSQSEFDLTADYVFRVAQTMAADINGWATLYSRKRLVLPG